MKRIQALAIGSITLATMAVASPASAQQAGSSNGGGSSAGGGGGHIVLAKPARRTSRGSSNYRRQVLPNNCTCKISNTSGRMVCKVRVQIGATAVMRICKPNGA